MPQDYFKSRSLNGKALNTLFSECRFEPCRALLITATTEALLLLLQPTDYLPIRLECVDKIAAFWSLPEHFLCSPNYVNDTASFCSTPVSMPVTSLLVGGEIVDISNFKKYQIMDLIDLCSDEEKEALYFNEHVQSLFSISTPKVKLYYPEPYIAAPSRIHNDLWIVHILHYQFWLWFFFIFIVVFFFLTFITVVRWNQLPNKPRRETRGVSRSKCGDLITACVPVAWAMSIIVSESTDSADTTDGFSTGELVVGVRAYQWGWEYYYPKSIDLNYNTKPSYNQFIGNSIKTSSVSGSSLESRDFWRHYQKKSLDSVVTPAHLFLLPFDNSNVANFLNFSDAGVNTLKQSAAFAKIRANSKLFSTNVVSNSDDFALKYKKLNKLAFLENSYAESLAYGNPRQHNLLSNDAINNNLSTFLNEKDMLEFLNSGYQSSLNDSTRFTHFINIADAEFFKSMTQRFNISSLYPDHLNLLNDSTDKKQVNHTFSSILSKKYTSSVFLNNLLINNNLQGLPVPSIEITASVPFLNKKFSTIKTLNKGENTTILLADQLTRNYSNVKIGLSNFNLAYFTNSVASFLQNPSSNVPAKGVFSTLNELADLSCDVQQFNKLTSRRSNFGYPHPIFFSNNLYTNPYEYDTNNNKQYFSKFFNTKVIKNVETKRTPVNLILSGDQTAAVPTLNAAYWRMFWSPTASKVRLSNAAELSTLETSFYMPLFTGYYDYDFRNAQAIELLEDAFWESSYSSYNFYDYLTLAQNFTKAQNLTKNDIRFDQNFLSSNSGLSDTLKSLIKPNSKDVSLSGQFYFSSIEADDFIQSSGLTPLKSFYIYPITDNFVSIDDSFSSYKNLSSFVKNVSNSLLFAHPMFNTTSSYLSVFNNFRSDFEDFNLSTNWDNDQKTLFASEESDTSNLKNLRISSPLVVRSGVKNSVVTFNALRKVFRARFDEGRSHTSTQLFASSFMPQPFINDMSVSYNQLLTKDKNTSYQNVFYVSDSLKSLSSDIQWNFNQNYNFYDLPFLLSEGSDPQKFMWFDWWAKWGMYEVQPSSVAKYSTLGVPYSRKHFDFGAGHGDNFQDVETYFIRVARLRKNYLPNWLYSPVMFNKLTAWSAINFSNKCAYANTRTLLCNMRWYDKAIFYYDSTSKQFTPSISGNNTYMKSTWRPFSSVQAYFYKNSVILDILTRREFLCRKLIQGNKKKLLLNLPTFLTASPKNLLIDEIKSSFLLIDPISYSSEVTRDFFYTSLPFFQFLVFKNIIADLNTKTPYLPINTKLVNEYLFFYALNTQSNKIGLNDILYKDQHRPMKKGITSMLRLHGTGAVAMPTEVRLQILASSRDVIHSWSIPSAGIKIDCVPGYTSHRIMTFNLTGIYWGQCMEICGRYHHWMPIIVYFMKRDLFFLWCTHFVFKSTKIQDWKITDRQYSNYIRLVSYDKSSWLNELSRL